MQNDIQDPTQSLLFTPDFSNTTEKFIPIRDDSSYPAPDRILDILGDGPQSAASLASYLNIPQASVRRAVQTLRKAEFSVCFASDNSGLYELNYNRR